MNGRALLGGTFDPVHYGHLRIADRLRLALQLPLSLLPTAVPPHKPAQRMTAIRHRLEMVRIGLLEFPELTLSELELGTEVAYTIDTLRRLRATESCDPIFVVGMDSVTELPSWHDFRALLEEFDLVAVARPGHAIESSDIEPSVRRRLQPAIAEAQAQRLAGEHELGRGGRIFPVELAPVAISSREIRARAASGEQMCDLVPAGVALYIQQHRLYREGVES